MARRIKTKSRKYLGSRTHGGGNAKNRRGKGNKGGVGRAGWHKHKWLRTIKLGEHKQRKHGFHSSAFKPETLTLETIATLANAGKLEKQGDALVLNAPGSKIVGGEKVSFKLNATAYAFSKKAAAAIEAAGGSCSAIRKEKPAKQKAEPKAA
ncbi:MAG: uL15 family ribosomal protein [Candidatus Micrarchaeota archaeon]